MEYYQTLQRHYESCLEKYGPTAKGMDWPNDRDLEKRFEVLMSIAEHHHGGSLLDLGCGVGLLIDYLSKRNQLAKYSYTGTDISHKMISVAREMHPGFAFEVRDILKAPLNENQFDFVVMNGVLTEKRDLSQDQMVKFAEQIIASAFRSCRLGLAFNVMSSHVDWRREDLFHWELDSLVSFVVKNCSRKIRIHMDYGLYEYAVHIRK